MLTQSLLKEMFNYHNGDLISTKTNKKVGWINGSNRISVCIKGKYFYLHRLIWLYHYGNLPGIIDHIDRDTLNNKIENLRVANPSESSCNRVETNYSGFRGVDKFNNRYRAKIRFKNKHYHIGYFNTPEEASEAYKLKALELHKEFAVLTTK
jgi:hypothetical protein